nr:integrase, catalytic region, zinc finger, CCHC-type, peptidase aspartic, catalytic [Tanacetum cinerariifolium]
RVVVQNVQGRLNRGQGNNPRGGAQENGVALDEEQLLFFAGRQDNAIDEDVDEQPVQDLALNVDNVFHADDCDAFDSDVDEAPTAQTIFMANLSSAYPIYDEVVCKGQRVPGVQSNVSSVPNNAYMMIYNDMYEPHAQSVSKTSWNTVVDNSLTIELATYKEQVELYERRARNNREAHLDYLRHLKESVETIHEIVEEANVVRPLDSSIVSACRYTNHSQEFLEYAIGTCPQDSHQRDKKHAPPPLIRKKQVTFIEQCDTSNSNTHKHVAKLNTQKTNVPVSPSIGVNHCTDASRS